MAVCTGSFYSLERMYIDASSGCCCIFTMLMEFDMPERVLYAGWICKIMRHCFALPYLWLFVSFCCFAAWYFLFSNRTMISYSCIFVVLSLLVWSLLSDGYFFHSCGTLGSRDFDNLSHTIETFVVVYAWWCLVQKMEFCHCAFFESRWWYFFEMIRCHSWAVHLSYAIHLNVIVEKQINKPFYFMEL